MGERRDEVQSTRMDLETGTLHEGGVWPDRCGWYYASEKVLPTGVIAEVLGENTKVGVGDDLVCTFHAALTLGVTEDRLARLGLVRSEFFDVCSVESLAEEKMAVHRDPVSCQQTWIGRCLWQMGELVLWANSAEEVNGFLAGAEIEGSFSEVPAIQAWQA